MLAIMFNVVAIIAAVVLSRSLEGWLSYVASLLVIGSRMRAFNNLVHETSHNLLFKNKRINQVIGALCAWPLFLSLRDYKSSHMQHHYRLGHSDDPDLIRYKEIGIDTLPAKHSWWSVVKNFSRNYIYYVRGSFYCVDTRTSYQRLLPMLIIVLVATSVWGVIALKLLFHYWVIPFLTTYQIVKLIAEIGEHGGLYKESPADASLRIKAIKMTRNMVPALPVRIFIYPHRDGFHMLHHRFPAVPGINLFALHKDLIRSGWYEEIAYVNNCKRIVGHYSLARKLMSESTKER